MNVNFTITFDYQKFYKEEEFSQTESELRGKIASAKAIEGAVVLDAENQPTIEIIDELLPWIQNLCFRAVSQLMNGEEVRIHYFSRSGYLDLKPVGDNIEVSGNKTASGVYPKSTLLAALFACGERFDALMREIKSNDPNVIGNLNYMRQFAEMAREVLR
ncbi:hypothetical protein [Flavilitoribacter nigricans]|uniref:Uncharacterized protein n=1 Tax=Flavilitoribacter nigricans (strain ATCC 23147 / DSM 23189 / NBRC 102662 / NCIMB 1420 / SS-2) TaxID=1122177 RepID=A0A2D0N1D2_FLAN2|nr:hypothetical protein [Flavilitoribacter nigricans]PHN02176.1 hypothetical protein CRP01_33100 [Flavilitoribacter nigricans DSM 23189 = NBRC 102662]